VKSIEQPNALALEYQRDYGTAHGDLNILDLVNNPAANGKCRVFGLSFSEQRTDILFSDPDVITHFSGLGGLLLLPETRPAICFR
jgi:hypothetical protein